MNRSILIKIAIFAGVLCANTIFAQNDVTFQVNMRVKMLEQVFQPGNGDILVIRGEYNSWKGNDDILSDADSDSIYSIQLNLDAVGSQETEYKYFIFRSNGLSIGEDFIANRKVFLSGSPQVLPVAFFDNDEKIDPPVTSGRIRYFLETGVLKDLGIFQPESGDTLQIIGPFNGWGAISENAIMEPNNFDPELFALNATVNASPGALVLYQFYLGRKNNSNTLLRYETPLATGGLRRSVSFAASTNQSAPLVYFNDIPPQGIIPAGKSVRCTFLIDMSAAKSNAVSPFDPIQDKVFLTIMDPWWAFSQDREWGTQSDLIYNDPDGDSIYELSFTITGPSYYGIAYRVAYGPEANKIKRYEGGDFVIHPSRVRYIQPNATDDFPDEFTFQTDSWQDAVALLVETPPFDPTPPANKPPIVTNAIPNQTIPLNSAAFNIDLLGSLNIFNDPNGDELVFSATASDVSLLNVTVNGSLITIQPLALGTTTIKVKADDKKGGTTETSFEVAIVEGNQPPRIINKISNQVLTVDGALFTINLNLVFEDPNGDPMSFIAVSTSQTVATAIVFAGVLRVSPKLVGSTTITVTAEDNRGGAESTSFLVTVLSGNQPPRIANEIAAQTLTVGGSPYTRDLNASPRVFADPNGDNLSYTASSSDQAVASASLIGGVMTISAVSLGTATITVFADDGKGGGESLEFTVTSVSDNTNSAPQVKNPIDGQRLIEGGASFTRNLDQPPTVFSDPDQDPLVYTATSSKPEVAEVTIFGSLLTVAPISQGNAAIEVVATDGFGGSRNMFFDVRVVENQPPFISHTPPISQNLGQPIVVDASISDDTGVTSAIIQYRRGGDSTFSPVAMTNIGGKWQGTIPGGDITSRGIEYQIKAFDQHQAPSLSPLASIRVSLTGEGENRGAAQLPGSDQAAFRLFSIPFSLHNPDPADVLLDDLGDYNIKKWRLFELAADQSYTEFGSAGNFSPGKSFWLIVKDSGKMIDSGPGLTNSTLKEYAIELQPQWNFIANPFNFVIPLTNLRSTSTESTPVLRKFEGSWSDPDEVTEIRPFEGYAIFNNSSVPETLYVNPNIQITPPVEPSKVRSGKFDWKVRITAQCQQAIDRDNIIGVSESAQQDWDQLDQPEPPTIGNLVSLHFPHPEWHQNTNAFSTDIREPLSDGAVWEFSVASNIKDAINLSFDGVDDVFSEYEVWLFDEALKVAKNLRTENKYSFVSYGDLKPKLLKIAIGKQNFFTGQSSFEKFFPANFELAQNFPNPFNPTTTIRFGLPRAANVSLLVYNLLGEKIATLVNDERIDAGYHALIWNGRNAGGVNVPSGVYFYRLQAGTEVFTKKMILVK